MSIGITDKLVAKNGAFEDLVNASEVGGDGTSSNALPADTVASGSASELVRVDSTGAYLEGAGVAVSDLATAAQGALADSALQSSDIGSSVQAYDAELAAIAGLASAANKVPYFTGSATAGLLDLLDEDDMASDSATAVPTQQSVKAYVDASPSYVEVAMAGTNITATTSIGYIAPFTQTVSAFTANRIYVSGFTGTLTDLQVLAQNNVAGAATGGVNVSIRNITAATAQTVNVANGAKVESSSSISLAVTKGDQLIFSYQAVGGNDAANNWAFTASGTGV